MKEEADSKIATMGEEIPYEQEVDFCTMGMFILGKFPRSSCLFTMRFLPEYLSCLVRSIIACYVSTYFKATLQKSWPSYDVVVTLKSFFPPCIFSFFNLAVNEWGLEFIYFRDQVSMRRDGITMSVFFSNTFKIPIGDFLELSWTRTPVLLRI